MGNRIESAARNANLTQALLAEAMGVTPQAVQQWMSGATSPRGKRLQLLASVLNVSVNYLVSGSTSDDQKNSRPIESNGMRIEPNAAYLGGFDLWDDSTPLSDDEVALPFLREVELAAGSGKYEVIDNNGFKLRFARSTLRRSNVQADNAVCVTATGNSMEPVIPGGTTLGIDMGCASIKDGDIYAIEHDGHLRVKMLYQMPGGVLRLRSFNSDEWPDEHYSGDARNSIRVIGRVFWWSVLR